MGKVSAATLTLKQLAKLARKKKRPNDVAIRMPRDEEGIRSLRYVDKDSPHVKTVKYKDGTTRYVANTIHPHDVQKLVVVGGKKIPKEHTKVIRDASGYSRRTFKKEYAHLYTPFHARQLIDAPVIRDLYSKYGKSEFMGRPLPRLSNKVMQRVLNMERAKKGYGPLSVAKNPSPTLAGTIKAAVPEFPSRKTISRPITRGRIKKEIELENYLKEIDPVTKEPRYLTTHTRDLAKDPRFDLTGTQRGAEGIINRIRKEHNPPLEKTISRYGTPKGTDIRTLSVVPTGRLRQAVDHFTQSTTRGSQKFDLIKSRRKKREQQLNNIVLGNLSPELKKTAEGLLKYGRTFMQALHETFSMHRSPEMAKALSTWVRNMKHSTAEHNVRKLRKMKKEVKDPNRKWEIEFELAGWDDDMRAIGVQSNIDGIIYGKWYDQSKSFIRPLVEDLPKEYPLKQMKFLNPETKKMEKTKFTGMNEGGTVNGYYRGGTSMRDYPQRDVNRIRPKIKPKPENPVRFNYIRGLDDVSAMTRMMLAEDDKNIEGAKGIAHVIQNRAQNPNYIQRYRGNPAKGLSPILSVLSGQGGFSPYSDRTSTFFTDLTKHPNYQSYYDYAQQVLRDEVEDFTGGADFFVTPEKSAEWKSVGLTPFGLEIAPQFLKQYGGHEFYKAYNKGGIARRPNAVPPTEGPDPYGKLIDDSVTQIMNNPSEYMGSEFMQKFAKGGFVKKMAPKVMGQLTTYKPKITMSDILKNIQKAKKPTVTNPYTIYDKALTPLKKFKTKDQAQAWLNKNYTADSNIHPEVVYKAKTTLKSMEPKAEDPGAMFWGSREKIIGAPSEAMTGTQWLQYMKLGNHGILNPKGYPIIKDMELNDTSLAPWLSRMGNKTISKDVLVKQFDEMAPKMDVTVLGESTGERIFSDMSQKLRKMDTQEIRDPAIKGFYDYIKAVLPQLKEKPTGKEADDIAKHINEMVERNFGVRNALDEGLPQRFPFEMKETLQQISTGLGKRTAGFKSYSRSPQHRGTQMMSGGDNYREFLFRYNPGSLRKSEPEYTYAHDFNLESSDRIGGVVHSRTSDRADEFGRRLLHIEEIQSDMHQLVNAAQRALKKKHADWAKAGKTPEGEYAKMTKTQQKDYDKLVADGKYAPRGDLKEEIGTANEQHLLLLKSKIEDLLAQKQTPAIKTRLNRLNKERIKVRKIIDDEKKKMAKGDHSGVPQGPLSKTEDYNEFIMKYMLKVAREGGYDGISINTPAIKNVGLSSTGRDYKGNVVAYGPMAKGAMEKAAKKSGAKFMKTYIVDDNNRVWEVPMILFKENKAAEAIIDKGLPIYKRGGTVKK